MNIREGCLLGLEPPPHPVARPALRDRRPGGGADLRSRRHRLALRHRREARGPRLVHRRSSPPARSRRAASPTAPTRISRRSASCSTARWPTARSRVCVVTPYFLPDRVLIAALRLAALRGVRVDIVLPEKSNLTLRAVGGHRAALAGARRGCRVWLRRRRSTTRKIMVVDGAWSLVGAPTGTPRSAAAQLRVQRRVLRPRAGRSSSRRWSSSGSRPAGGCSRADLDARPLPVKLRDGVARLLAPVSVSRRVTP